MSHPEVASFREFAGIVGCKPGYVTQLRKAGRLVLTDDGKRVRVAESLQRIADTRDPAKAAVAERHAAARNNGNGAAFAPPPTTGESGDEPDLPTSTGYTYWRERTERAKALAAERENDIAEGKLLDAAEVEAAVSHAVTQLRTTLEGLPYDLAPELAPITDEGELRARLVEAVELALGELSRQFAKATQGEDA